MEKTANKFEDPRVEISTRCFRQTGQHAFYDVRVFCSNAKSCQNVETRKCYEIIEKENSYNEIFIQH